MSSGHIPLPTSRSTLWTWYYLRTAQPLTFLLWILCFLNITRFSFHSLPPSFPVPFPLLWPTSIWFLRSLPPTETALIKISDDFLRAKSKGIYSIFDLSADFDINHAVFWVPSSILSFKLLIGKPRRFPPIYRIVILASPLGAPAPALSPFLLVSLGILFLHPFSSPWVNSLNLIACLFLMGLG